MPCTTFGLPLKIISAFLKFNEKKRCSIQSWYAISETAKEEKLKTSAIEAENKLKCEKLLKL